MKSLIYIALIALAACGQKSKVEPVQTPAPVNTAAATFSKDSADMADAIHRFFKWYGETGEQLINKINFIDESGPHPKLDLPKLGQYLGEFYHSDAICEEFVQNETIFYRACSQGWKNETSGEVITCMDSDHYYCQQDGEVKEFLTAGVSAKITGGRAEVKLMLDPNGPNGGPRDFEMKKENGKWLLSKVGCL